MRQTSRPSGRLNDEMRLVTLEAGVVKHAEGSCLVKFGDTHVLCTASVENQPPPFLRGSGRGWVTAEYGMLPRATAERTRREAAAGKQTGRTQEIQRDRKSTRLNSSHLGISYAVFCLKKKKTQTI